MKCKHCYKEHQKATAQEEKEEAAAGVVVEKKKKSKIYHPYAI